MFKRQAAAPIQKHQPASESRNERGKNQTAPRKMPAVEIEPQSWSFQIPPARASVSQPKAFQANGTTKITQLQKAKSLEDTLAERIGADTNTGKEGNSLVRKETSNSAIKSRLYKEAVENHLFISPESLSKDWIEPAREALKKLKELVSEAKQEQDDEDKVILFNQNLTILIDKKDNIGMVLDYFKQKVIDKQAAEDYLAKNKMAPPKFDLGIDVEEKPHYEAKARFFGPDQTTLDIGTQIANRVLKEALATKDQVTAYAYIAKAIQETSGSGNECLQIAHEVLEIYLKPKIQNFINTLPSGDRMNDDQVWDGKKLGDDMTYKKGEGEKEGKDLEENDTWVKPKVEGAWSHIRQVVSPAVLNHAGRAKVVVDGMLSRPYYSGNEIHLGWFRTSIGMVMHEFGHHLEDHTTVPRWIRIQQFLRERSKGELKSIFPFSIPYVISKDEMKYDAPMPASGVMGGYFGYNAKYYEYGSTEVVSTALEMFHDKEKSYQIAIRDPELFLAVMGVLRGK